MRRSSIHHISDHSFSIFLSHSRHQLRHYEKTTIYIYILKTSSCFVSLDSSSKHLSRLFSNRAENSGNPVRDEIIHHHRQTSSNSPRESNMQLSAVKGRRKRRKRKRRRRSPTLQWPAKRIRSGKRVWKERERERVASRRKMDQGKKKRDDTGEGGCGARKKERESAAPLILPSVSLCRTIVLE